MTLIHGKVSRQGYRSLSDVITSQSNGLHNPRDAERASWLGIGIYSPHDWHNLIGYLPCNIPL